MTHRVPTRNASPKTEKFSAWKYLVCFCFQIKQNLDLSSGATYVTLEYAISSLITVAMATKARADAPICYVALGGAEQASAPKMDWQMQHLYYTYDGLWERQPPPHTRTSHTAVPNICARILTHHSVQAMAILRREDLWRERTELGSSCSIQHGAFCSMWFSAGNLYGCLSLGKWEISPSPSVPLEKALLAAREALRWSRHEGNRKTDVGESSACLEGKSYTFFKWSLIWYSHPEKQI